METEDTTVYKYLKLSPKFFIGNLNGFDFYKVENAFYFVVDDEHTPTGDNFFVIQNAVTMTQALEIFIESVGLTD